MDNVKIDEYYINQIIGDLKFVENNTANLEYNDIAQNEVLLDSIMFRLIQVSENVKKLTDAYRDGHSEVPWRSIIGMRNKIVHDYGHVDISVIYDTVKNDIPVLIKMLEE